MARRLLGLLGRRDDRGQSIAEFMGTLPFVLFIILIFFEAYITITTVERVENATRTCARIASQDHDLDMGKTAGENAMPDWVNASTVIPNWSGRGGVRCVVNAQVPLLWKGVPWEMNVRRQVDMPVG